MADNKESESTQPKDPALEKRIDAMMDPKQLEARPTSSPPSDRSQPALDIFSDPKTAPEVPGPLLSELGATNSVPESAPSAPASPDNPAEVKGLPDYENVETDKAVDDIVASEGDTVLAAEDAATRPTAQIGDGGFKAKLKHLLRRKRIWVVLILLLVVIFAVPVTRYKILGLIIKKSVSISIIDSKTHTPVSSAEVSLAGVSGKTDANGKATIKAPIGSRDLIVTKQYYTSYAAKYFVGFKAATARTVSLVATGRQVPITVVDVVNGKPLAGAEIKVLDTTAKTNATGKAVIVLPTKAATDAATVQLSGYNTAKVSIQVTGNEVTANTLKLTPSGHIYFLSNLSGNIDVVKTNLDGTGRQTVLAGTGKEDPSTTSLLATRDWRYLVLQAKRDNTHSALYLIDTATDKLTQFDTSDATFNLIGWYGHDFVYDLVSNTVPQSQNSHELVKSYDAENTQLNQLDQTQAEGTATSYGYQGFSNFYILDNAVVYTTHWYAYDSTPTTYDLSSKTDAIRAVQPGRQNKKDYQTFPANNVSYIQAALYEPQAVNFAVFTNVNKTTYYTFENQAITTANLTDADFGKDYPTYLLSPSGAQTFWTEPRDGKNSLFTGSNNAANKKQIASLSDYAPYGWYGDNYILVSKASSELYVMPVGGVSAGHQPLKITDYYKPARTYNGYGYGYGGL